MEINLEEKLIAFHLSVYKSKILRDDLIKEKTSQRRVDRTCLDSSVRHRLGNAHLDLRMKRDISVLISKDRFAHALEGHSLSLCSRSDLSQIVDTEDHIL